MEAACLSNIYHTKIPLTAISKRKKKKILGEIHTWKARLPSAVGNSNRRSSSFSCGMMEVNMLHNKAVSSRRSGVCTRPVCKKM